MRVIVISNGSLNIKTLEKIRVVSDFIICADGGANHLYKSGILPDMIVGDLDSLTEDALEYYKQADVSFHKFPSRKDNTDTELAVDFAIDRGAAEIILLGSTGTRLDHTLANIMILLKLLKIGIKAKVVDEHNEVYIVDSEIEIEKEKNTFISFIPIFKECIGVTMKGFKYSTDDLNFVLGSTMGVSNEVENEKGIIEIRDGISLVIKSRD